jgi:NADPH:quinone reductase-like Zn-dependent oxidoreductase
MKAIRYGRYGSPDVLELREVDTPAIGDGEVLVRVQAASVNPLDFHFLRGTPYFLRLIAGVSRPKVDGLGADLAGRVEAVGRAVTRFRPGDAVFGSHRRAFAEYAAVPETALVSTPDGLDAQRAAAVPVAGVTALQALRDRARVRPGQRVLVNGAGGGVGTFAVQLAKGYGAEVTGVCGTHNVELVASIGADHVIDHTREDYTRTGERYDVIVDNAGNHSLSDNRRALARDGVLVGVGGPDKGYWIGALMGPLRMVALSPFVSQRLAPLLARVTPDDLTELGRLVEAGTVTPVIDRTYPLREVPEAIRYLEQGHASGKVVITV